MFFLIQVIFCTQINEETSDKRQIKRFRPEKNNQIQDYFTFSEKHKKALKIDESEQIKNTNIYSDNKNDNLDDQQEIKDFEERQKILLQKQQKEDILKNLELIYNKHSENFFNAIFIEKCLEIPLIYINGYVGCSKLLQRRLLANDVYKNKSDYFTFEENTDITSKIKEFLVEYFYFYYFEFENFVQFLFKNLLNNEIKKINNSINMMVESKNNADMTFTAEPTSTYEKKHNMMCNEAPQIFESICLKKNYNQQQIYNEMDCIQMNKVEYKLETMKHHLFDKVYTGYLSNLIALFQADAVLHEVLAQKTNTFIKQYEKEDKFYLMLLLRNCILATHDKVMQSETETFYELTLIKYLNSCAKSNKKYTELSHETILGIDFEQKSQELKVLYLTWIREKIK